MVPFLKAQDPVLPELLNKQADSIIANHENAFLGWVNQKIKFHEKSNERQLQVLWLNKKAEFLRIRAQYQEVVEVTELALECAKPLKNPLLTGEVYNILGKTLAGKGDYAGSAKAFIQSLTCMEKAKHLQGMGFMMNNIGIVYDLQKNYVKALEYYQKSVKVKIQLKDSAGLATGYNNLGITYYNLEDIENAYTYHQKALVLNQKLKREESVGRSFNNLGLLALKQQKIKEAEGFFRQALAIRLRYKNEKEIATTYTNLAKVKLALNQMDSANIYNKQAYEIAQKIQAYALCRDVYVVASEIHKKEGKFEVALRYRDTVDRYNDSLINEENIKTIAEFESKYQHEKMRRTISEKNMLVAQKNEKIKTQQTKTILWSAIALVALLGILLLGVLFVNNQRKRTMLNAQLLLIQDRNHKQQVQNEKLRQKMDEMKLNIQEKEQLLNTFYAAPQNITLPSELLSLSERETEVLSHLALGWSDQEIADKLYLSKATVKTHLRRIYSKLLVKGRAEAVRIAHQYKILGFEVKNTANG